MSIWVYSNGKTHPVASFTFPGGELQVSIPTLEEFRRADISVIARLQSSEQLVKLLLVSELLRREHSNHRTLVIPYFPYARQDRVMASIEAFSLKSIATLIAGLPYDQLRIYDPHSDVTTALLDRVHVTTQSEIVFQFGPLADFAFEQKAVVISPDAGAAKKASQVAKALAAPIVTASKIRDTSTGAITGTEIQKPSEIKGRNCLIVDDICDGGKTFIELAKVLKECGANTITLYVTHGIFSKGFEVFHGLIDRIYCTDTFIPRSGPPPKQTPLFIHPLIRKEYGHEN